MAKKYKVVLPAGPVKRILPGEGIFEINDKLSDTTIEKFIEAGITEYFTKVEDAPAEAVEPEKKNVLTD